MAKANKMTKEEQYHELSEDTIKTFKEIEEDFAFMIDIKYQFQGNAKGKKLIEVKKIADNYSVLLKADILVLINEDYFMQLEDDIIKILFAQELDKLHPDIDKGTIKVAPHAFRANPGLFNKYDSDGVLRANEIQEQLRTQKDAEEL